jgi:hypothetical protein
MEQFDNLLELHEKINNLFDNVSLKRAHLSKEQVNKTC